jgi:hypothetical protein
LQRTAGPYIGANFRLEQSQQSRATVRHVKPALSLAARFDGEFAGGEQTYAGFGTPRYAW